MPDTAPVLFETEGALAIMTLNRPEQRNSVNAELAKCLRETVARFEADPDLRVAILTGAGKVFCAGMALAAFLDGRGNEILFGENRFAGFVDALRTKPIIAAVEGAALAGGLEIALACDLIVASEAAVFGLPEVGVGIFPVAGGAFRLARKIPANKALELVLTAEKLTATAAHDCGLINVMSSSGRSLDEARKLAKRILRNAPRAVEAALAIHRLAEKKSEEDLWQLSETMWPKICPSQDACEGPRAFKEKRAPIWTG